MQVKQSTVNANKRQATSGESFLDLFVVPACTVDPK
jgi:hypothetical protein